MQTSTTGDDLKVGISNKQILKIALPISLAMLVPQINFVVNNVFLGKLGEKELAIAGITGVIYLVFALIGNGLNSQSALCRVGNSGGEPVKMSVPVMQGVSSEMKQEYQSPERFSHASRTNGLMNGNNLLY